MIRVLEPGPQTTVQDVGRTGQMRYGIPPSGPVDRSSFVLANRLVGNLDGAAALEFTLMGPRLRAETPCTLAVSGADAPVTINDAPAPTWTTLALEAGDVMKIGAARAGVRGYIAVAGGIDVAPVLGSRAPSGAATSCSASCSGRRPIASPTRASPSFSARPTRCCRSPTAWARV